MGITSIFGKIGKQLSQIDEHWFVYFVILSFFGGLLISGVIGKNPLIFLIALLSGLVFTNIRLYKPQVDIVVIFNVLVFLIGLLIFSYNKFLVIILYLTGLYIGTKLKKYFN